MSKLVNFINFDKIWLGNFFQEYDEKTEKWQLQRIQDWPIDLVSEYELEKKSLKTFK